MPQNEWFCSNWVVVDFSEAKMASTNYQAVKALLYQQLEGNNYGTWVKKPTEVEMFAK